MCKKNPLMNTPMSRKRYTTWERNQAHELIIDCRACSPKKQKRCTSKMSSKNKGTPSNKIPTRKVNTINLRTKKPGQTLPQVDKAQTLNRRRGFTSTPTGKIVDHRKQYKINPIVFGRTADRWGKLIHE